LIQKILSRTDGKRIGLDYKTVWSSKADIDMLWYSVAIMDAYFCPTDIVPYSCRYLTKTHSTNSLMKSSSNNLENSWQTMTTSSTSKAVSTKTSIQMEKVLGDIPFTVIQAEHDIISDNKKATGWIDYTMGNVEFHVIRNAPHLLLLDPTYSKSVAKIIHSRIISWKLDGLYEDDNESM
jgi:pimeloyl-ACP methyl ester carboxylesterase